MTCTHGTVTRVEFDDRFSFSCSWCHEMGYGTCYRCAHGCNHQLHEECWTASPVACFSFFAQKPFILQQQQSPNNSGRLCTACGMAVKGLMYSSTLETGVTLFLHPTCMKLPHRIEVDDGGGDMDKFSLVTHLRSVGCLYCNRTMLEGPINGWAYVSADQKSACHVKCLKNRLYEDWIRYVFVEEPQKASHKPWWLDMYNDPNYNLDRGYDHGVVPWAVPSAYSCSSTSPSSSQGQRKSVALTVNTTADKRRQMLWKFVKVAFMFLVKGAIFLLPLLL